MNLANDITVVLNNFILDNISTEDYYNNDLEINDEKITLTVKNKKFSCDSNLTLKSIKDKLLTFINKN